MPKALALLALSTTVLTAQEKIIFDTDSGFFNDDGVALVMLGRSPQQVKLLGVTTVPGNVWARQGAFYMLHNLALAGRPEVPVYVGAEAPLMNSAARAEEFAQKWGLEYRGALAMPPEEIKPPHGGKFAHRRPERKGAVEFIIETVEANPGEVTIVAVGPMTNLALALDHRPEIAGKIKRLVFMGGSARAGGNVTKQAEFNFWFDPEAARTVLRSAIKEKVMFGLDICNRAVLTKAHFDQIVKVKTPVTQLYREDFGNGYPGFLKNPQATGFLWDELAAAWLIDPAFVTRHETLRLEVDTTFGAGYGAVREAADGAPVQVMLDLDFAKVFAIYRTKLTQK
jgi:inosine-uridine nucleoside N-ribohydrolase